MKSCLFQAKTRNNDTSSSCTDLSYNRVANELDDQSLADLERNNANVRSMFESLGPKYKFGGSHANLRSTSLENRTNKPVASKPKQVDNRSWVLKSINKHFDVIVEDEEDYEYDSSSEENEDETSEIEQDNFVGKQSSEHMKDLLRSVVSHLHDSDGPVANKQIIDNLKKNLEAYNSRK